VGVRHMRPTAREAAARSWWSEVFVAWVCVFDERAAGRGRLEAAVMPAGPGGVALDGDSVWRRRQGRSPWPKRRSLCEP
jgi:hypothetical protein